MATKAQPVYKTFRAIIKEVDVEAGLVNALIPMSTPSVDRSEEVIEPGAFKKSLAQFMKRPILLASHNYMDLRSQIGEFKALKVTDDGLMADGLQYYIGQGNEQADWGFNLASKGMAAFSVGFIPLKWEKLDEENEDEFFGNRKYTEVELLEVSQVVVPANRDAIQGVRGKAVNDPVALALCDEVEASLKEVAPPAAPPRPKEITQEQLKDDIDYLTARMRSAGLALETIPLFWALVSEGLRFTGADIPVDILTKYGAVLNAKNRDRLNQICQLAQEVIDNAEPQEDGYKETTPPESQPNPVDSARQRAQDVAEVANIVIAKLKGKRIPK